MDAHIKYHINGFAWVQTESFLDVFVQKVCGVPRKEEGWWGKLFENSVDTIWRRVEYAVIRGIQHWHIIVKLPSVVYLPTVLRLMTKGHQARIELIKVNAHEKAIYFVQVGLLAERCLEEYADSLVHRCLEERLNPIWEFGQSFLHILVTSLQL
jgi:hypothetical protein